MASSRYYDNSWRSLRQGTSITACMMALPSTPMARAIFADCSGRNCERRLRATDVTRSSDPMRDGVAGSGGIAVTQLTGDFGEMLWAKQSGIATLIER